MTLLVDPPSPRDRGGQRQSTQRSATDQLDGAQGGRGLEGVFAKDPAYWNPVTEALAAEEAVLR